jgi:hypothetical protein
MQWISAVVNNAIPIIGIAFFRWQPERDFQAGKILANTY